MPLQNKHSDPEEALIQIRTRLMRACALSLIAGLAPVALGAWAMAKELSLASPMWVWVVVITVVVGAGAGFLLLRQMVGRVTVMVIDSMNSELRLRRLMGLSGDWFWQQDSHHAITSIVHRGADQHAGSEGQPVLPFLGLARWDVPGLSCTDKAMGWEGFKRILDSQKPFDKIVFEYWPQGSQRLIFESTGRPIYGRNGEFAGYFGVSADLTQKRLNEQMLALQRSLLQGILLSAPIDELAASYARGLRQCLTAQSEILLGYRDGRPGSQWRVRTSDPKFRVNPAKGNDIWSDPTQYCEPLEGTDTTGLVGLGQLKTEHFMEPVWSTSLGVSAVWMGYRKAVEPLQPEYWIMVVQKGMCTIHPDDMGRILIAVRLLGLCVERRVFEDDLQELNSSLEHRIAMRTTELTRTNSELEAFTYTVSHDLRAPLRAIDGFSSILREDFSSQLDEEAQRLLNRISSNARQMGGLIDGLLDFSRLLRADLAKVEVDVQQLVDSILEQLDAQRKHIVQGAPLPVVMADPVLFRQVWSNLIDNAIKFTGKVEHPRIELYCDEIPGFFRFTVRDNGAGFDMKYADKLFNVFERLHHKNDFDGTGVGLATVKRIIERHGGEISATGEPGKGACFVFTIPTATQGGLASQVGLTLGN